MPASHGPSGAARGSAYKRFAKQNLGAGGLCLPAPVLSGAPTGHGPVGSAGRAECVSPAFPYAERPGHDVASGLSSSQWPRPPSLAPLGSIHLESASFRFRLFGENCMRSLAPRFPLANSSLVCQGRKTGETEWEQAPPCKTPHHRVERNCASFGSTCGETELRSVSFSFPHKSTAFAGTLIRTGERAQGAWVKVFSAGACPAENDWICLLCQRQSNWEKTKFFPSPFS